ncbi:MAG: hypothetical protein QNI90_02290 [Dinoroseobacter sp.]|nr:hypothetical protein [Dinoroseobacter sp.]MDJ0992379.1 hypothetical protein [Dinoroseobacter sp.]
MHFLHGSFAEAPLVAAQHIVIFIFNSDGHPHRLGFHNPTQIRKPFLLPGFSVTAAPPTSSLVWSQIFSDGAYLLPGIVAFFFPA